MNSRPAPSLRDLLLLSDFGRANPRRVAELVAQPQPPNSAPVVRRLERVND